MANQSYFTGDTTQQAILDVEAGEEGLPEYIPPALAPPAGATQPAKKHKHRRHKKHRRHHQHR